MKAAYVQPVKTPATPLDVSRAYFVALRSLTGKEPTAKAVAVLHAHCALETGNMASCWNHNVGNIKAGEKYEGFYTCIRLNELLNGVYVWFSPEGREEPKGNVVKTHDVPPGHPQTRMRAYASLARGIEDKIRFLSAPHWKAAFDFALRGDPNGYVRAIRALGYFTAQLDPYERAVVSLTYKYLPVAEGVVATPTEPIESDEQLCRDMSECLRTELPDWLRARVNVHVATLGLDWDEQRLERDKSLHEKDTDPMLPETHTGDTERPPS